MDSQWIVNTTYSLVDSSRHDTAGRGMVVLFLDDSLSLALCTLY